MTKFRSPVQLIINDVTLIFNGPAMDPVSKSSTPHPKDKAGPTRDYLIWTTADTTPATHNVDPVNVSGDKIELYALRTEEDWWHYKIWAGSQTFKRKYKGGQWEKEAAVTDLRIQLTGESVSNAVIEVATFLDDAILTHAGSNCTVTWNASTRRYTRICS